MVDLHSSSYVINDGVLTFNIKLGDKLKFVQGLLDKFESSGIRGGANSAAGGSGTAIVVDEKVGEALLVGCVCPKCKMAPSSVKSFDFSVTPIIDTGVNIRVRSMQFYCSCPCNKSRIKFSDPGLILMCEHIGVEGLNAIRKQSARVAIAKVVHNRNRKLAYSVAESLAVLAGPLC